MYLLIELIDVLLHSKPQKTELLNVVYNTTTYLYSQFCKSSFHEYTDFAHDYLFVIVIVQTQTMKLSIKTLNHYY